MTWVIMVLMVTVAGIAQARIPGIVALAQTKAPLLPVVVLYYALHRDTGVVLAAGFLAGFLQDALSPIPLGYSVSVFCAVGWAASRFRKLVLADAVVTQLFFGAVAGCAVPLVMYMLLRVPGLLGDYPVRRMLVRMMGTGLLGALCAPPVFFVAGRLERLVGILDVDRRARTFE